MSNLPAESDLPLQVTPDTDADAVESDTAALLKGLDETLYAPENELARTEALERMALYHAQCDDAAKACWYLCRSLGLARQQEPGEPNLELLFELLGALADLPAEVSAMPVPESVGEADGHGIFELCHQLAAARDMTQDTWDEAQARAHIDSVCPSLPASHLH